MMDTKEKEMLIHIINAMDKAENISNEIKRVCPPQQCLRFSIDKDKQPSIFDNKLGGKPYWDLALSYPTDEKGKPMAMVFQVNFEQCPHLEPLPAKGILQFFISSDEDIICEGYGCDYDNPNNQTNYRIVYHKDVNRNIDESLLPKHLTCEELCDYTPVKKECALTVKADESCVSISCKEFDSLFISAVKKLYNDEITNQFFIVDEYLTKDMPEDLAEEVGSELFNTNPMYDGPNEYNFQMLGFPAFEQVDERTEDSKYDTLLLQIPSINSDEEITIWGDCGSMRVFINQDDLNECNFSDVHYEFQCY